MIDVIDYSRLREVGQMSFVNFWQSRDIIEAANEQARIDEPLVALNAMIDKADKDMLLALSRRYNVSMGFILRAIFEQWREYELARSNVRE